MKKLVASLLFCLSASALGHFQGANVNLYNSPYYEPQGLCDFGTNLILDEGKEYLGKVAVLSEFVSGVCEIAAVPNTRLFTLVGVNTDHCSRSTYTMIRSDGLEKSNLMIYDNRQNTCDFPPMANKISATVIKGDGSKINLYPAMSLGPVRPF